MEKVKLIDKIISWGLVALVFLLPLFFLPLTPDFYFFNKLVLLVMGSAVLLIVYLSGNLGNLGSLGWKMGKQDLAVLAFLAVNLISTFLNPHPIEAMYGQTGMVLGLTLLYFLTKHTSARGTPEVKSADTSGVNRKLIAIALLASVVVLSVIAFYQAVGLEEIASPLAGQPTITLVNPAGSRITLATFLIVSLPLLIRFFKKALRGRKLNPFSRTLYLLGLSLGLPALILSLYQLINEPPLLLPLRANWQITVEGFKNLKSLFLGIGPANFIWAFTRFKPLYLNRTPVWNLIFTHGRSEYLHLLTTTGLAGILAFAWMILESLGNLGRLGGLGKLGKEFRISLYLLLFLFLVLPGNFLTWLMLYVCLGQARINADINADQRGLATTRAAPIRFLLLLPILVLVGIIYFAGRAWLAEHYTYRSALAAQENKGLDTYNWQQKAIQLNPYLDAYHLNFANTCFLLANSLSQRENLTDQDQTNIINLIQQAIREANIATSLAPHKSTNWQFRGNLYRNLINFAQGAADWTVACLQQALRLDPANPRLRVDYGGLFYLYQNYEDAIEQFKLSVQAKFDYANGWYNLSAAYRDDGKFSQAVFAMQQVLNFLPADSPDRPQAESELAELQKKVAELLPEVPQPSEPQEALELPESPPATPSGVTPIELPSPPPEPSPTPTVTPTEVPSPSPEASPTATVTP